MRKLFVSAAKGIFNILYRCFCIFPRKDEILFVSRQTNVPSDDFMILGKEFKDRNYEVVFLVKKLSPRTVISYTVHVIREIYHLARCKACFLDRYDPIVSLINFEYESISDNKGNCYKQFPRSPIIIQLWHAFGAFKCFGFQSLDTSEGLTKEAVESFQVHRNYSWIFCTGESSRKPFSEAFGYPIDRVLPFGRPTLQAFKQEAKWLGMEKPDSEIITFLFAPTLRKNRTSQHPFKALKSKVSNSSIFLDANILWSMHPLEETGLATGQLNKMLLDADYVITDYSSIVYEAFLLGKRVLFFVPDIENYSDSPGININPEVTSPEITFRDEEILFSTLEKIQNGLYVYPESALLNFVGDIFSDDNVNSAVQIADFVGEELLMQALGD